MRLLIATQNQNKKSEILAILGENVEVMTLKDLNDNDDVIESGDTFFENALIKASHFAKKNHMLTLADDSGLCVDALGGAPGIYSARYSGLGDQANIDLLLDELKDIEQREAMFVSQLVLYDPITKSYQSFKGELHGIIIDEKRGSNGFGYDPVFLVPELKKTLAELTPNEKNSISHRAIALKSLKEAML